MVRKVRGSLGAILADAQERGLVGQNVVRAVRARRRRGKEARADKRQKGKLKVGVDIPSPDEIRAIVAHLEGRWRPLLLTAIFTGLRASELRGLRWEDVDLTRGELSVRQRADCFNAIGQPKTESGERTVPLLPMLVSTLRAHRLACPKGALDLVFPNGAGKVENYSNIVQRGLFPALIAAGVVSGRPAEIHRLARLPAFLRQLVHQPPRRRRARAAVETGAGPARPRLDHDDGGLLRPSVPARRRPRRARRRGKGLPRKRGVRASKAVSKPACAQGVERPLFARILRAIRCSLSVEPRRL